MGSLDSGVNLTGNVLIVEDNDVNRMIAREGLQLLGLNVIEAGDGVQALEQWVRQSIDLVLMDCQMPVTDGYAATVEIRKREAHLGLPRLPVLALTANAFEEDARHSSQAGMDAHLARPCTREPSRDLRTQWL